LLGGGSATASTRAYTFLYQRRHELLCQWGEREREREGERYQKLGSKKLYVLLMKKVVFLFDFNNLFSIFEKYWTNEHMLYLTYQFNCAY
jgi:hypothetical protein